MIVKCPQCNREYNVDERLLSPKGAMGKCKPCGIRFKIDPPGGGGEEITCPKCGFKQVGGTECRTCGIVFDKMGMETEPRAPADSGGFVVPPQRPAEGFSPPPPPPLQPPQMRSAAGGRGGEFVIGESIGFGWNTVKQSMGFFILLTLASFVIEMIPSALRSMIGGDSMLVGLIFWIIGMVVQALITMGYVSICLTYADGGKAGFEKLFSCGNLILNYVLASILVTVGVLVASILSIVVYFVVGSYLGSGLLFFVVFFVFMIPGIVLLIRLMFFMYAIVDRGMGPVKSLTASWEMTQGVTMDLVLLFLLCFVINIVGLIPLGLGLLITVPLTSLAYAYVYRKLEQRIVQPAPAQAFAA